MADLISDEALEILKIYKEYGALEEFLLHFVEASPEDPYLFPEHQQAALDLMWRYSHLWMLMTRRAGKTFLLGNGMLGLGCLLSPVDLPIKIGLYSGSFAQVKLIFSEIMKTWNRSPFIQSITEKSPKILQDRCEMVFKGHGNYEGLTIEARPLNPQRGADTSRGFGFQILVVDEFQMLPRSVYASIFPTASASGNPMKNIIEGIRLKNTGILEEGIKFIPEKNRLILAGTAGYTFLPAYDTFQEYTNNSDINRRAKELIPILGEKYTKEVQNKVSKLISILPKDIDKEDMDTNTSRFTELAVDIKANRKLLDDFKNYLILNWSGDQDYVYRVPYAALPNRWHDRSMISMQRSIFTEAELDTEYNCNWRSDSTGPFKASRLETVTFENIYVEDRAEPGFNYFIGVDPGHTHSDFAVAILKQLNDEQVALVNLYITEGIPIIEQVRTVYRLVNAFWPVNVLTIDSGAGGAGKPLAAVLGENKDSYDSWGVLGPLKEMVNVDPMSAIEEESSQLKKSRAYRIINLFNMSNQAVSSTNDMLLADLQGDRFFFAAGIENVDDEEIRTNIRNTKKTMTRLIRKVKGNIIAYDLPGKEGQADHHHDDWSALTCALAGYYLYKEEPDEVDYSEFYSQSAWLEY